MSANLKNKVCAITGAAGLLGHQFTESLLDAGAKVCLLDIDPVGLQVAQKKIDTHYKNRTIYLKVDITEEKEVAGACESILSTFGKVDILINNAAKNPKVEKDSTQRFSRLENFRLSQWNQDLAVGLTGAFLCCKIFGTEMAKQKKGTIVNIASDLSVIAPDQRIYQDPTLPADGQPVKPLTYSVVKTGLVGLTRYLATYWADAGIRVNALSPGGVFTNQPNEFVERLTHLIPMGRMARVDEYKDVILFLCSDASQYMTGQNIIMDGGRSVW